MESELEDSGQRATFQPSDQNLQTVCQGKILHPQKAPPCFSQPPARNRNLLPTYPNVSSQENRESESA